MSYIVPMDKPNCFNCSFRTGDYCGILAENEKVKECAERYETSEFCPLIAVTSTSFTKVALTLQDENGNIIENQHFDTQYVAEESAE